MRLSVIFLLTFAAVLLLVAVSEGQRPARSPRPDRRHHWAGKRRWGGPQKHRGRFGARKHARRPGMAWRMKQRAHRSWRSCAEGCREDCNATIACKNTQCPITCAGERVRPLCMSNCRVNLCATNSCVTCFEACRTRPATPPCHVDRCADVCVGRGFARKTWNARCKSCLLESCRPEEEEDDDEEEVRDEDEEDEEEQEEEQEEEEDDEEEEEEEDDDILDVLDRVLNYV